MGDFLPRGIEPGCRRSCVPWIRSPPKNCQARKRQHVRSGRRMEPDGRSLGFITNDVVKRVDISGGQKRRPMGHFLGRLLGAAAPGASRASFCSYRIRLAAGSIGSRQAAEHLRRQPGSMPRGRKSPIDIRKFLRDGRHFIYWVWSAMQENTGEYVNSLDPGEKLPEGPLLHTWREAHYVDPGYLLFLQGSTLMAHRFYPDRLRFSGEPRQFPDQIGMHWNNTGRVMFSTSATGTLAYQEASPRPGFRIVLRGRRGNQLRNIEAPPGSAFPSLDPAGRNVVVFGEDENSSEDLWRIDLERAVSSRLTAGHGSNQNPIWSPDGQRIAFQSNRSGSYDLYAKNADGSGEEELLVKSPHTRVPTGWSMDGRFLAYYEIDPVNKTGIWVVPLGGDRKPIPFLKTGFNEFDGHPSPLPDGQGHRLAAENCRAGARMAGNCSTSSRES